MEAPISASLGAMGSLLGKLDVLLAPEYRLPKEAKDGIQLLRGDLQEIATSLVDLSEAEDPPLTAKCWMKDVRELSYDMEDYVDELLHSGADAKAGTVRRGGRFKIGRLPWTLKRQPLITNRVSEFRSHVQEAIQRHERYNLGDCISRRRHLSVGPMLPTEYKETDDLLDGPRNELLKWLTNEEEERLKVVSIVGSGGLGKTTLATKLYRELGGRFDCRAFLHTSQKPDMKRLLGGMLSQLRHHHQPPDACEVPELIHTIRTHLHDKSCCMSIHLGCTVPSYHLESNMRCLGSILGTLRKLKSLTLVSTSSRAKFLVPCDGLSFVSPVPRLLERLELLPRICIFPSLPKWIGELGELCTLKIAISELRRNDVDTLKRLSTLTILSLCVREAPLQRITFHSTEFPVLRYFKFRCREACLTFEEGAMPNLRRFKLGFDAYGAEQHSRMPTGLENLLNLEELTARIRDRGATESDRRAAESALRTMNGVHGRCPGVHIFWVDWIFYLNESILEIEPGQDLNESIVQIEAEQEYGIEQRDEKQKYYMDEEGDTRISMPSGSSTSNLASSAAITSSSTRPSATGGAKAAEPEGRILEVPKLRVFTFAELKAATRNFKPDTVLGEGRFGRVNRGWVHEKTMYPARAGTGMSIAVKRLNLESVRGLQEWQSEVNFLGRLWHPNLVRLLGYCWEDREFLLVYEFMARGSLENHLFRKGGSISWGLRLHIVIGAARGLTFLHSCEKQVIYRDFRSSNILLDMNYNAKLSNFGLAIYGPTGGDSHVSTRVMGTLGYAAPEYLATGHLYVKSDVYGFGVVLLEMLTGLRALDRARPAQQHNLVYWAKPYLLDRRKLARLVDQRLEGQYPSKAALRVAELTLRCLSGDPRSRPSMAEVVAVLEEIERMNGPTGGDSHVTTQVMKERPKGVAGREDSLIVSIDPERMARDRTADGVKPRARSFLHKIFFLGMGMRQRTANRRGRTPGEWCAAAEQPPVSKSEIAPPAQR